MTESVTAERINFRGQKAYRLPSGRIVTVEAWEGITDDARRAILAEEPTRENAGSTDVDH